MLRLFSICLGRDYCYCCCKKHRGLLDPGVARSDEANIELEFEALARRPSKVDMALETNLTSWERAIAAYREAEQRMLEDESQRVLLLPILAELREGPEAFLSADKYDASVRQLATMRCIIFSCQSALGLSRESTKRSDRLSDDRSSRRKVVKFSEGNVEGPPTQSPVSRNGTRGSYTQAVSLAWAERLANVIPVQGSFQIQKSSPDGTNGIRRATASGPATQKLPTIRPKWPHYLADVWYEVIKINKMGMRQRRQIKLTEFHILSIKGGNALSKIYLYMEVAQIWLQNSNMAVLRLRNDNQLRFVSPVAATIVQQITARVKVRTALEKNIYFSSTTGSVIAFMREKSSSIIAAAATALGTDPIPDPIGGCSTESSSSEEQAMALSFSFTQQLIESISEENDAVAQDVLAQFASTLRDRTLSRAIVQQKAKSVKKTSLAIPVSSAEGGVEAEGGGEKLPEPPPSADSPNATRERKALKLFAFDDGSPEHRVQAELQKILYDETAPEGNTRKLFIEEFSSDPQKTMLDMRLFMDGLHDYILESRGKQLSSVLTTSGAAVPPQVVPATKLSSILLRTRTSTMGSLSQLGAAVRAARSSTLVIPSMLDSHAVSAAAVSANDEVHWSANLAEEEQDALSYIVFAAVEESVFLPLLDRIVAQFPKTFVAEDAALERRMQMLSSRSQEEMNIEKDHVSALGWESAVFELSGLERAPTPSMKIFSLVRSFKAIYAEYKQVVVPGLLAAGRNASDCLLGADNLVPIFIYVFCRSQLKHPILYREILWSLVHPDQLHGECGFFLTVFESSIAFVLDQQDDGTGNLVASPPPVVVAGARHLSGKTAMGLFSGANIALEAKF